MHKFKVVENYFRASIFVQHLPTETKKRKSVTRHSCHKIDLFFERNSFESSFVLCGCHYLIAWNNTTCYYKLKIAACLKSVKSYSRPVLCNRVYAITEIQKCSLSSFSENSEFSHILRLGYNSSNWRHPSICNLILWQEEC